MENLALFGGKKIREKPFPKHPIITDLEKNDKQHDIRFASAIKTLDIMIAQGDLENAMKAVELLKGKYHRRGDNLSLRIKSIHLYFSLHILSPLPFLLIRKMVL